MIAHSKVMAMKKKKDNTMNTTSIENNKKKNTATKMNMMTDGATEDDTHQ